MIQRLIHTLRGEVVISISVIPLILLRAFDAFHPTQLIALVPVVLAQVGTNPIVNHHEYQLVQVRLYIVKVKGENSEANLHDHRCKPRLVVP